ncbi:serine/threonine-protein kinase [Mycoplasmopsis felifaucium]|uniref:serine/threonine-protein kinase n=1 Tax=Mycoplasmopsis felifaucium TaxID=35768 RepID=UPI000487B496|nr:serine/threonine-protein kinase [Mycoplasmopsis felifaucium]
MINASSKVFNKYKIIKSIGSGGFSLVYQVELINDPSPIKTKYALKYFNLDEKSADRESSLNRFKQEIQIMQKVHSEFFPKYIDSYFGDDEQYLVMEYVEGTNLRDLIRKNGKIIQKEAVNYLEQLCDAVHELHANKIVHRDIKSHNIMITKNKNVKLLDFGLSLAPESQRFTQTTKIVGSVYYMAPELCNVNNKPNEKTDIYALGILLYELLIGQYPIQGNNAKETLTKQKHSPMPRLTDYIAAPQSLENVIIKATAKDPNKRYPSAWHMKDDLKTVFDTNRIYEKPLNIRKIKQKKTMTEIINSKEFLISMIVLIVAVIVIALVTMLAILNKGA